MLAGNAHSLNAQESMQNMTLDLLKLLEPLLLSVRLLDVSALC